MSEARHRFWPARLLLLAYLAWAGARSLTDVEYWSLFAGINFGVHELGHLVFAPFGEWLGIAGGSLAQVVLPVAAAALFRKQSDRFAVSVCVAWLAISLANLAVYIGDARAESLDLVSFSSEGAVHDWNYLLDRAGLLRDDRSLARFVRAVAWLLLGGSVAAGARIALRRAPAVAP